MGSRLDLMQTALALLYLMNSADNVMKIGNVQCTIVVCNGFSLLECKLRGLSCWHGDEVFRKC